MKSYTLFIYSNSSEIPTQIKTISANYNSTFFTSLETLKKAYKQQRCDVLIFISESKTDVFDLCLGIKNSLSMKYTPLLILGKESDTQANINALESGCDDYINIGLPEDEIKLRIDKSIFNQIANRQLSSQLGQAQEVATLAIYNSGVLGDNIQFLLGIQGSENLDELGQFFFRILKRYDLSGSLQIRSTIGIKNMEANGMDKNLESKLLTELKDSGRFIDFGKRTIINYERISLLIRNMPLNDRDKYGMIKDSVVVLLEGMNARVKALEDRNLIVNEREALKTLSQTIKTEMIKLKQSYYAVSKKIVGCIETTHEEIFDRIPGLGLTDQDEKFLEKTLDNCVLQTNQSFNDGLKLDKHFTELEHAVAKTLSVISDEVDVSIIAKNKDQTDEDAIQLF